MRHLFVTSRNFYGGRSIMPNVGDQEEEEPWI